MRDVPLVPQEAIAAAVVFPIVAQISNLLYRRLPVGMPVENSRAIHTAILRVGNRDTADWKSALQPAGICVLRTCWLRGS